MSFSMKPPGDTVAKKRGVFVARILKAVDWLTVNLEDPAVAKGLKDQKLDWVINVNKTDLVNLITVWFQIDNDEHKKTFFIKENRRFIFEHFFNDSGALSSLVPDANGEVHPELSALTDKRVKVYCYETTNPKDGKKYTEIYDYISGIDKADSYLEGKFGTDTYLQTKLAQDAAQYGGGQPMNVQQPAQQMPANNPFGTPTPQMAQPMAPPVAQQGATAGQPIAQGGNGNYAQQPMPSNLPVTDDEPLPF